MLPHPLSEPAVGAPVEELAVTLHSSGSRLALHYQLTADLERLQLPETRSAQRTDGLWRHCCFEAFIGVVGAKDYWEYNFSPSGAWAAYHFTDYREGMEPLMNGAPPELRREDDGKQLRLEASVDLSWLTRGPSAVRCKLGLAAVIEDRAHVLSYWALKHPGPKPDFHHADGFAIELDLPATDKLGT